MPQHYQWIIKNQFIARTFQVNLGSTVVKADRFAMGLSHYVFDVLTEDNSRYVIRIARPTRKAQLEEGLRWHHRLAEAGVPLPKIIHTGEIEGYALAIYERLPGNDLEEVYAALSSKTRKRIACSVADIQANVKTLDHHWFENTLTWADFLQIILLRSEREIVKMGLCDVRYADLVRKRFQAHEEYINGVQPQPFLYDTSVRNIIIQEDKISGVVDVDEVWFGDPLLAVGRGKTLLFMMEEDTDFISYWCDHLKLTTYHRKIVDLYALLYCLRFMGTLGQTLNGNPNIQTDPAVKEVLELKAAELIGN